MLKDPDQPNDSRLKRLGDWDLGFAGGVSFHNNGQKGVVIFAARNGVDFDKLRGATNEAYLRSAADLIGSAWALRGPKRAAERERKRELDAALPRARIKLVFLTGLGYQFSKIGDEPLPKMPDHHRYHEYVRDKVQDSSKAGATKVQQHLVTVAKKCKGGAPLHSC